MDKILKEALDELKDFVKKTLQVRIEHYGYNPRAKKNTLVNSRLVKDMKITTSAQSLALEIADYWEYVACGWARSHRFSGTYGQFVYNINKRVKDKNISVPKGWTQNQIAFMFFKFFTENGIVGRPFMMYNKDGDLEKMIPELKGYMEKWFDNLFDRITEELDKYFNE